MTKKPGIRYLPLWGIALIVALLLATVAPIVPVPQKVTLPVPKDEPAISDYALMRMTDFALLQTIYDDPTMVTNLLVPYSVSRNDNSVRELEGRFYRNPAKILTKGILFLLWENLQGVDEDNVSSYLSLRWILKNLYCQLPFTPEADPLGLLG